MVSHPSSLLTNVSIYLASSKLSTFPTPAYSARRTASSVTRWDRVRSWAVLESANDLSLSHLVTEDAVRWALQAGVGKVDRSEEARSMLTLVNKEEECDTMYGF